MMRDNPTKGSSRVKLKGHHIKAFTNSVGALEQLGVEAGGTAVDPKEQDPPCVFGSSWGFSFFKDKPLTPAAQSNQRTNGPVNAHLRSATYANKHV